MKKTFPVLLGCALMLCTLAVFAADKRAKSAKDMAMNGWISDAKCGAKNASTAGEACAKKCLEAGGQMVFVNDKDQKVIPIDNPDTLKGHEGHHVTVMGKVENGQLHVDSFKMLKAAS